ncbi:helix-turn-helix transcriptional regulator [Candidatus Izemoplasma sp. B36]|uniref:helix-turn-helix transcriptional regulator n=1 Tax=Candidatus Izemoplasma sp. B36 TaxID=3242468 RepID=UPI003556D588
MEYLASKIIKLRKENNFSQDELASKIGVSRQAISKWERNEGLPDLYNIKKLAEVFHISVDELIQEKINKEDKVSTKNKASFILMSIPSFLFVIGLPLLFLSSIVGFVIITQKLFIPEIIYWDLNWGSIFVPIGLLIVFILIKLFVQIFSKKDKIKYKIINIIIYGLMILVYLLLLTGNFIYGFSLIFLYIVGLLILISGLIGTILNDGTYIISFPIILQKILKISSKIIKYTLIIYMASLTFNLIEDEFLVQRVTYVDDYLARSDEFYLKFTEHSYDDHYYFKVRYDLNLPDNISNPSVKIYLDGMLIAEGNIDYVDLTDYDYRYFYEAEVESIFYNNKTGPNDSFDIDNIVCVVTYELDGVSYSPTYYIDNTNVTVSYNQTYMWNRDIK